MRRTEAATMRLRNLIGNRQRLIGVAVGSGMAAAAAEQGGADLLMALSAGFYRSQNVSSMASLLPLANANKLTWDVATRYVLPLVRQTPVVLGLCPQDPALDIASTFDHIREVGIVGITNFPTVGCFQGHYREALEEAGLGYGREVQLLRAAHEKGLFTIAFCFSPEEAVAAASKGVDILNLCLGFTEWRELDATAHQAALDQAVQQIRDTLAVVAAAGLTAYATVFGGPVVLPEDVEQVFQQTDSLGYIGGSAIERFPAMPTIVHVVRSFKQAAVQQSRHRLGTLTGRSPRMHELFKAIRRVARSDAPVLILGESGTGKELVAKEIHSLSRRADKPLVCWNCGTTGESLAMSELFGHEKGAFTGATATYLGKFETAHGATLFMDEVSDLPLSVQASLLRVLQENEIVRVGSQRTIPVDVRVIAASNRDFAQLIQAQHFRLDLYYRLSTIVLSIPPLRERREDIPLLIREFLDEFSRHYACPIPAISDSVMDLLIGHNWPGNVRQLRAVVERGFILGHGTRFQKAWLEDVLAVDARVNLVTGRPGQELSRRDTPAEKRARAEEALRQSGGNKSAAAQVLGVTRKTLYAWLASEP